MRVLHYYILIILAFILSGCFLFGVKGIFDKNNYLIVKLEIDDRVVLSPQELANEARAQGGNVESKNNEYLSYDNFRHRQASRLDSINTAFEQLRQRNQDDLDETARTPINELAKITLVSTLNLDRTQDMIYGKVGCNDYTAKFFWQDSTRIVISGAASTRKICTPKEVADFQDTFIKNFDGIYAVTKLKNRRGYVLNNGRIRIYVK